MDALEARAHQALDWRRQFRENPRAGLAVAFSVGVVAAALLGRRHEDFVVVDGLPVSRLPNGSNSALQAIQTAILGFLAHEARQFVAGQFGRREEPIGDVHPRG
jgi:hypothetical protein